MHCKSLFILFVFIAAPLFTLAQQGDPDVEIDTDALDRSSRKTIKNMLKSADNYYNEGTFAAYQQALPLYLELLQSYPEHAALNYKTGICYLETNNKQAALSYLQTAEKHAPNISPYLSWNLGRAYHQQYRFDEAITHYETFKSWLRRNDGNVEKANRKIRQCERGKAMVQDSVNAITEIPSTLNSAYPDYCPLIMADESAMYFTSRRPLEKNPTLDPNDGLPYENIMHSVRTDNRWQKAESIGPPINNEDHNATVGLSVDGQQMIVYFQEDLYISKLSGDEWSNPKPLPPQINSRDNESSACFSFDGKELFFIRGREPGNPESNGDIYHSKLRHGKWTEGRRLSRRINTKYDEDGVFLHPDGKTLYFSSKGHQGMGGFDVYKSVRNEHGRWSEPVNLGYPVNTPADDLYFVLSADGKSGWYSSFRPDGEGMLDIVHISFLPDTINEPTEQLSITDSLPETEPGLTLVKGTIRDGKTEAPLKGDIRIFDVASGDSIMQTHSNASTGKYLLSLPAGKGYAMEVKKEGYVFYSDNFNLPDSSGFQQEIINIRLYPIEKDVRVVLNNIFFDLDKATLRPESHAELDRLKQLMNENPDIRVEISGHTDTQGNYKYNKGLSKRRAAAVVDYLTKAGIDKSRLESRGASWDEPIATNETEAGRQKNRRVEFKIID